MRKITIGGQGTTANINQKGGPDKFRETFSPQGMSLRQFTRFMVRTMLAQLMSVSIPMQHAIAPFKHPCFVPQAAHFSAPANSTRKA
jgi:hypothetical protein